MLHIVQCTTFWLTTFEAWRHFCYKYKGERFISELSTHFYWEDKVKITMITMITPPYWFIFWPVKLKSWHWYKWHKTAVAFFSILFSSVVSSMQFSHLSRSTYQLLTLSQQSVASLCMNDRLVQKSIFPYGNIPWSKKLQAYVGGSVIVSLICHLSL